MANIIKPALTPDQEKHRQGWKYRAIEHARGNQTKLGCILIRICGRMSNNPPRFDIKQTAIITSGGMLLAHFQPDKRTPFVLAAVCRIEEYTDELRKFADKLKLTQAESDEMFVLARQWVGRDFRSTSDPQIAEDRLKAAKKLARLRRKDTH